MTHQNVWMALAAVGISLLSLGICALVLYHASKDDK